MKKNFFRLPIAAALALAGCAHYQPQPLDAKRIEAALAAPSFHALRIAVTNLHHPYLPPVKLDLRDGITPEVAAVIAVIANPQLRAARDERGIAAAQLLQAGILPNPSLDASLDLPSGSKAPDNFTAKTIGLSWEITALISRQAQMDSARAHEKSVALDIAWQEWQVAQAARLHVLRIASLQESVAMAADQKKLLAESVALVRGAVERHDKTDTDLAAAEDALQTARAGQLDLEHELAGERGELNATIGLPPGTELKIAMARPEFPRVGKTAAQLFQSLENRLDLLALKMGYESSEAGLRAEIRRQFPKIGIGIHRANDTANIRTTGFGVTLDLPVFDRNQGQIALAKAERQQLYDDYIARVAEARADIARLLTDLDFARRQLGAAEEALPTASRLAASAGTALERGDVDVISFYDAGKTLAERRMAVAKWRRELSDLSVALETAAGGWNEAQ